MNLFSSGKRRFQDPMSCLLTKDFFSPYRLFFLVLVLDLWLQPTSYHYVTKFNGGREGGRESWISYFWMKQNLFNPSENLKKKKNVQTQLAAKAAYTSVKSLNQINKSYKKYPTDW